MVRPNGWLGKLRTVNNGFIGLVFLGSTFLFFALSGFDSLALRAQLALPELDLIGAAKFNQLFTTHGTAMMFPSSRSRSSRRSRSTSSR